MNTPELYSIAPLTRPEHITIFDESTKQPALIHVESIASIFTESTEQHKHDGPILLGVRFLYKRGQESFFYIDEKKYAPLICAFNPTAVGEELHFDISAIMEKSEKKESIQSTYLTEIKSLEFIPGDGKPNTIVIKDKQENILLKDALIEWESHLIHGNQYVLTINNNFDNFFEIKTDYKKIDSLKRIIKKGASKRLNHGFVEII